MLEAREHDVNEIRFGLSSFLVLTLLVSL